ncbi:MAG: CoA transferase [Chloroflexota bacterium]
MEKLPLDGIRAIDFTTVAAGPHATQWLGVMGAEVIKVETILRPDTLRGAFPPGKVPDKPAISSSFAAHDFSKKDITLNMTQPKAIGLLKELVKVSDIVAENFGGSVLDRWGLGYADLKKLKPDIILYSGSGFGRTGPRKESPAYAPIIDAFTGLLYLNGYAGGEPGPVGAMWTDLITGTHGAFAILSALYHRSQTGEGQHIDLSMCEMGLAVQPEVVMDCIMNQRVRGRTGNRDDIMAPHGCYRCQGEDKWVAIAVSSQEEWESFCKAIGSPEWTTMEEFSDELSRWNNQEALDRLVEEWTKSHTHDEVMAMLQSAGVMAGATLTAPELADNTHLKERQFFWEAEHSGMATLRLPRAPWRVDGNYEGNYHYPPLLGEHNDYVFGELLGLSGEEIARLKEEKVIY